MPELPEVEHGRRLLERVAAGRRIERAECARDSIVYEGVTPERFRRVLSGRRVLGARRRGKYLWLELDERPWPLFHFGMTGSFRAPDAGPLPLASSRRRAETAWPPRFTKLRLHFTGGGEVALTNARRLGRIRLRDDPLSEPPLARLGFDPLLDLPRPERFRRLLERRSVSIKGLLLDQRFAAGVGNWIADEVLYQAGIDPRRPAAGLAPEEVERLRRKLRSVVRRAVAVDADKTRFPRTWLFHSRWGRDGDRERRVAGRRVERIRVAGRTTAWVPEVQR